MEEAIVTRPIEKREEYGHFWPFTAAVPGISWNVPAGLRSRRSGPEYGLSGNIGKAGRQPEYSCHTGELYRGQSECGFGITAMPDGWEGYLQGGNYQVSRIHVKNGGDGGVHDASCNGAQGADRGTYTGKLEVCRRGSHSYSLPVSFWSMR